MIDSVCLSGAHQPVASGNGLARAEPDDRCGECPAIPVWVMEAIAGASHCRQQVRKTSIDRECTAITRVADGVALVSAHLPRANGLNAADFRRGALEVYRLIRTALAETPAPHPVRMWNFIPGIHCRIDGDLDRYQVFNQARHAAFLDWLGDSSRFELNLPTATGIGHAGDALVIHALATAQPGQSRENPRQTPAFRYSRCWGPQPPCFSRAVIASMPGRRRLLIGGTASVRGEQSVHTGSLAGQLTELLTNLQSLLAAVNNGLRGSLDLIREVRMYHRCPGDRDELHAAIVREFIGAGRVEIIQADICRRELLVEIEAVADMSHTVPESATPNTWSTDQFDHASS